MVFHLLPHCSTKKHFKENLTMFLSTNSSEWSTQLEGERFLILERFNMGRVESYSFLANYAARPLDQNFSFARKATFRLSIQITPMMLIPAAYTTWSFIRDVCIFSNRKPESLQMRLVNHLSALIDYIPALTRATPLFL